MSYECSHHWNGKHALSIALTSAHLLIMWSYQQGGAKERGVWVGEFGGEEGTMPGAGMGGQAIGAVPLYYWWSPITSKVLECEQPLRERRKVLWRVESQGRLPHTVIVVWTQIGTIGVIINCVIATWIGWSYGAVGWPCVMFLSLSCSRLHPSLSKDHVPIGKCACCLTLLNITWSVLDS